MNPSSIRIKIPKPCTVGWENMDMTERGAFCHSCRKEVVDFSAMTDREVIEYLAKSEPECGRFSCIVWLGHASFFMRLNGVQIITDPVFYNLSGIVRRHSEMPCDVADFKNIDYVLLSHGHRDHCDRKSLKELYANNKFELLTGLNDGKLVEGWLPGLKYQEAGWFQQYKGLKGGLKIYYLPAQHWSNRYPWDLNETLWGSMMIQTGSRNVFFGGDSGYCDYPKKIAELFPFIDIAMIGVGAYTPDYMMQDVHTSPNEAVQVIHDLKAANFIPMHYGTFDLADEPMGEPERILVDLNNNDRISAKLLISSPGEMHRVK